MEAFHKWSGIVPVYLESVSWEFLRMPCSMRYAAPPAPPPVPFLGEEGRSSHRCTAQGGAVTSLVTGTVT